MRLPRLQESARRSNLDAQDVSDHIGRARAEILTNSDFSWLGREWVVGAVEAFLRRNGREQRRRGRTVTIAIGKWLTTGRASCQMGRSWNAIEVLGRV